MFCSKCGKSVPEESEFCLKCGSSIAAGKPGEVEAEKEKPPSRDEAEKQEKQGGFWHSPAAVALVIILGLLVIGGIITGVILVVRGSSGNEVDADTLKAWDHFEDFLQEDGESVPDLTVDTAALQQAQEDLKKKQARVAELQNTLAETTGAEGGGKKKSEGKTTTDSSEKAMALADALAEYEAYLQKLGELFGVMAAADWTDIETINRVG